MHKFLRSIGFSDITQSELDQMIRDIVAYPQLIRVTRDSEDNEFAELSKEFAPNMGICVRGVYEEDDQFRLSYYYPFFIGTNETTQEHIDVEKHAEKESYAGVCDDVRLGVTLIFYLQNVADYLAHNYRNGNASYHGAVLSALASEGKILLPIEKKEQIFTKNTYRRERTDRSKLIAQAREGDQDAIDSLTMEDMDMCSLLSRRVLHEDILSIVRSTFMPYGIESDQYAVLGEILDYTVETNRHTDEKIYCLRIDCNEMIFDICINQKNLMGCPEIGRRFKGNIWMQGSLCLQ